ncbi:hypothetical protein TNCT_591341 [Trichonephila clavata]|uniref:Uncharacterized protein n=1 Tax=Trichonephila clavata TaxID=2740835 RepID=A0A8X6I4W0_TRICU|nr:hypothetical protein TNCT_591341 [Trichonephila clavata]
MSSSSSRTNSMVLLKQNSTFHQGRAMGVQFVLNPCDSEKRARVKTLNLPKSHESATVIFYDSPSGKINKAGGGKKRNKGVRKKVKASNLLESIGLSSRFHP